MTFKKLSILPVEKGKKEWQEKRGAKISVLKLQKILYQQKKTISITKSVMASIHLAPTNS